MASYEFAKGLPVIFDTDTFALTSLSIPPSTGLAGHTLMIAGDKVLTIGEDVIVVANAAVMQPAVMAEVGNPPAPLS